MPHYRDFVAPKSPGTGDLEVTAEFFEGGFDPFATRHIGSVEQVTEKLLALFDAVHFDRFKGLVGWGGMPIEITQSTIDVLASTIAPPLRARSEG